MAVVMSMHWPEITSDHYERALKGVRWEEDLPNGARFHVAWFGPDGFHVVDVWESEERFQQFNDERLTPVMATFGLTTQPSVSFAPVHRTFNPGMPLSKQAGTKRAKTKPAAKKKPARPAKARKASRKARGKAKR